VDWENEEKEEGGREEQAVEGVDEKSKDDLGVREEHAGRAMEG